MMRLAEAIKVRLTEGQAARYAAEADSRGVAISTYIRERLEAADNRSEELVGIREALVELGDTVDELRAQGGGNRQIEASQDGPGTAEPSAVQIETLMLLRAIASPEKRKIIWSELDRQGIETWQAPVR